ncbi:MAG: phytanoyl-CoA dioxygenase family protein [Hyphomicrobiaceae bacterium]
MTLTTADLSRFQEEGFLHVRGLLNREEDLQPLVDEYKEVVARAAIDLRQRGLVRSTHSALPFAQQIARLFEDSDGELHKYLDIALPQRGVTKTTPMHNGPAIFDLMRHPRLLDAVEVFIGPEIYSNPTQHVRIKPPVRCVERHSKAIGEISTTVWHQDQGTVTSDADDSNVLTAWIAVTEANKVNGCLLIAPGSHKRGLAVHCHDQKANYSRQAIPESLLGETRIAVEVQPGDVIFLHKLTMHASLPNVSDGLRWSLDFRYNPIGQPTGRSWFPGFIARSRDRPESELHDAAQWAALWQAARDALVAHPPTSFQRWSEDDPACA